MDNDIHKKDVNTMKIKIKTNLESDNENENIHYIEFDDKFSGKEEKVKN